MRYLTKLFGSDPEFPRPPMEAGEKIVLEGTAAFIVGTFGGRGGKVMLTNQRFLWYEDTWRWLFWPHKRISGQASLSDIAKVDKGALFDFVAGGRRLRLRLRSGKHRCFWMNDLNQWVAAVRDAIATAS